MSQKPLDALTDHEYDGIREYDNPTPGWWHMVFIATVVFSAVYFIFFQFSPVSWTVHEAYQDEVAEDIRRQFAEIGELQPDEQTLLEFMNKSDWMAYAAKTYETQCRSCHAEGGKGDIGPNMTDDYYKNVRVITDLPRVVANGAANGAMPAWKTRLGSNDIVLVSAYMASLRGQSVSGGKKPEGEPIPPWPEFMPAATQAAESP